MFSPPITITRECYPSLPFTRYEPYTGHEVNSPYTEFNHHTLSFKTLHYHNKYCRAKTATSFYCTIYTCTLLQRATLQTTVGQTPPTCDSPQSRVILLLQQLSVCHREPSIPLGPHVLTVLPSLVLFTCKHTISYIAYGFYQPSAPMPRATPKTLLLGIQYK